MKNNESLAHIEAQVSVRDRILQLMEELYGLGNTQALMVIPQEEYTVLCAIYNRLYRQMTHYRKILDSIH